MKSSLVPNKMCLDKERFSSQKEATRELNFWKNSDYGEINRSLKAYKCAFCSGWHIGKSTRR